MASTFTPSLAFNRPALGDAGWGTSVNDGFTTLADIAIAGLETVNVAAGNIAMTIDNGASGVNDARNMVIRVDGALIANRQVTVPANTKLYYVFNNTSGAFTVEFKTASGTGFTIPQGKTVPLRSDGTNIVYAFDHLDSLTLNTALPATSGGTGQGSYAVGDLLYASSTTALSKLTVGANDAVLTVAAGIPSWVATLPVASGGTGAATLAANNVLLGNGTSAVQTVAPGTAGNVLTSVAGTWASAALPASYTGTNCQIFGANGNFTVPAGITSVYVAVMAGGGGGQGGGSGGNGGGIGGAGGAAFARVSGLTPLSSISVTVGDGGAASNGLGTSPPAAGSAGNNSSFGSYVTCTGGAGGTTGVVPAPGAVTTGAGATLLVKRGPSLGLTATGNAGVSGGSFCSITGGGGGGAGSGGGGGGGSGGTGTGTGGVANGVGATGSNAASGLGAAGGAGGAGVQGGPANGGAAGAGSGTGYPGGGGGGGGAVVVFW